jgi:sigma-B regulation protein RsbU (phosphoserine phosphatase)
MKITFVLIHIIGAMPEVLYNNKQVKIDDFSLLFVFSDGAYEIQKKKTGEMWTLAEWLDLLARFCKKDTDDMNLLV